MELEALMNDLAKTTEHILSLNRRCFQLLAETKGHEPARESEFLDFKGAAKYTTLSEEKLRSLAKTGKIAVCKTGDTGRSVFHTADLKAYLLSLRQPTEGEKQDALMKRADEVYANRGGRERRPRQSKKAAQS